MKLENRLIKGAWNFLKVKLVWWLAPIIIMVILVIILAIMGNNYTVPPGKFPQI